MKKNLSFLFCGIMAAFGICLVLFGLTEASRAVDNDVMFTHMFVTIPGFLGIIGGLLCLTVKAYKSGVRFVLMNFFYLFLIGFIAECIYFQFFYFGVHSPQLKLMIPAALTCLVYGVLYMIFHIIFRCIYRKK